MTKETYKRVVEIQKELERLEDEIKFLSKYSGRKVKLLRYKIYSSNILGKYEELLLTESDMKDFKAIKEKRIEDLKQELDQL